MDRRTFLFRAPAAVVGGVAAVVTGGDFESPERLELRALLERATNNFETARNLIHWPFRYAEARPLLESVMEDAAQVWLRTRGVRQTEVHYSWSFTSCNVTDQVSGVAWNQASLACTYMEGHCDHIAKWRLQNPNNISLWSPLQQRARSEFLSGLKNVSQCLECARHAFERRTGALPPLPKKPKAL